MQSEGRKKKDKRHKMEKMNMWWVTYNPVTCADVGFPSFLNGQTKREVMEYMPACLNAYGSRIIKKHDNTQRKHNSA